MRKQKTYRLYISHSAKIMVLGMLVLFTIIGLVIIAIGLGSDKEPLSSAIFGLMWLGGLSFVWYTVLSMPHTIRVLHDNTLEFIGLLRRVRISPHDIHSIKADPSQYGLLVLKHRRGKLRFPNQFDDFHELVTDLKAENPHIETRGC